MDGPPERQGAEAVAGRVARNSSVRAAAEVVGKLSALLLLALLAREVGAAGLGVFVFAIAWAQVAAVFIGPGLDRLLLRRVARDRDEIDRSLPNVLALKLGLAVPVTLASWVLVGVLDYPGDTRTMVYLFSAVTLLDTLTLSLFATFDGLERGDLVGLTLMIQRLASGLGGIAVLLAGGGITGVAVAYVAASAGALAVAASLLVRYRGRPRIDLERRRQRELGRLALPLSAQEIMATGITYLDTILLAAFASAATVGLYGAAYRLLEATLFLPSALMGAFSAMFAYLGARTEPTINAVVARAYKLAMIALVPFAVAFAVLPGDVLALLFGAELRPAAPALRLLAPTILLLGVVLLSGALITSRLDPGILVRYLLVALVVNLTANLALVPPLEATGAALAMLLTELVLAVLELRIVVAAVGPIRLAPTLGAAAAGGAAMAAVLWLLRDVPVAALAAGGLAYAVALAVAERRLAPGDFALASGMIRARLVRAGPTGA